MSETRRSSPEWAEPADWRILDASQLCDHTMARGDIIVGPYPDGVQGIFPPGAWSNTPPNDEAFEHPYTKERWRLGTYLEPSPVPATLTVKTVSEVVDLLLDEAPQFIEVVKKSCTRTALNFAILIQPDAGGHVASAETTEQWYANLKRMREEATEAFGRAWVDENLYPSVEDSPDEESLYPSTKDPSDTE